jgi:dihydroorotate dehydrogenase
VRAALGTGKPPLLVKIAPDLAEADLADIAAVALAGHCDGLIVSNTTIRRPEALTSRHKAEAGGLSGAPLAPFALAALRAMYRLTEGRVPLVGVGGIASGADAYERIRAGAALVQIYTALVYEGPALVTRIKRELAALLRRDGFAAVAEAVGADYRTR